MDIGEEDVTPKEAENEYKKLKIDTFNKTEAAVAKAKEDGTWSNIVSKNDWILKPIEEEYHKKFKELKSQIDT